MNKDPRPATIFCDIDGTLIHSHGDLHSQISNKPVLLEGTIEKLVEWDRKGYNLILTTGRRESLRRITEQQLESLGIFYDALIMGLGGGPRYVINDLKPDQKQKTALAFNLERNKGIKNVKI